MNKTARFVGVYFYGVTYFSIEKELKIELHRHCNNKNGANYFRFASSHSSLGLHLKPSALFLNCWICMGTRFSSVLKVKHASELGLEKHFSKRCTIPTFMQLPLEVGKHNLH